MIKTAVNNSLIFLFQGPAIEAAFNILQEKERCTIRFKDVNRIMLKIVERDKGKWCYKLGNLQQITRDRVKLALCSRSVRRRPAIMLMC